MFYDGCPKFISDLWRGYDLVLHHGYDHMTVSNPINFVYPVMHMISKDIAAV